MEIFVFLRMGGKNDEMLVRLLDDTADVAVSIARFDAGRAKCFLDEDRQRLLAVIEATFGTFAPFNSSVRSIFAAHQALSHRKTTSAAAAPRTSQKSPV